MHFNSLWGQNEEIEKFQTKPVKVAPNLSILLVLALFCYWLQKSAQGGTWTLTPLLATDFKSAASTNSATRACERNNLYSTEEKNRENFKFPIKQNNISLDLLPIYKF